MSDILVESNPPARRLREAIDSSYRRYRLSFPSGHSSRHLAKRERYEASLLFDGGD